MSPLFPYISFQLLPQNLWLNLKIYWKARFLRGLCQLSPENGPKLVDFSKVEDLGPLIFNKRFLALHHILNFHRIRQEAGRIASKFLWKVSAEK